jgi:hypothetical protein
MIQLENHGRGPFAALDRVMTRYTERSLRVEAARINDVEQARRTVKLVPVKLLLVIGAMITVSWTFDAESGWQRALWIVAWLGLSLAVSLVPHHMMTRQMAYGRGWRAGRRAMLDSMREAERRGLTTEEWWEAEIERDLRTLL